jgi:nucleoside-diphosphate-sugar epimerase
MRVLMLGSSGFIGRATQSAFISAGHQVFGLSRRTAANNHEDCTAILGDRENAAQVLSLVKELRIDCIIDFKAMCFETSQPLIDALATCGARYVMISSSDVYRNYGLLNKLDSGEPDAVLLVEASPLRVVSYPYRSNDNASPASPDHWKHTYDKIPIEAYLAANHDNWTILRLPMVYGPGDGGLRFDWALHGMIGGRSSLKVPRKWLNWTTTLGFVGNIGAAIAHAGGSPLAAGEVFNIGDIQPMPQSWWLSELARCFPWTGDVVVDESENSAFERAISGLDLRVSLKVSSKKIERDLGFVPPFSLDEALVATIADAKQRFGA